MLALLFRHGVGLAIPGPTSVSLEGTGSMAGEPRHLPAPGQGPASSSSSALMHHGVRFQARSAGSSGADGNVAPSVQYGCSCLWDRRELIETK